MKTSTLKSLLLKLTLILIVAQVSAQNLVGTRIDVQGARFSDQMWLFSVASCTYKFDNGWDGYKIFGTSIAPQIFGIELDGYYQVASIPNVNNMYLGFAAGVDSIYTFTFTHQNLSVEYNQLYMIDSVSNKTIDIYQTGTTYTFKASKTLAPVKRFKIVTSKPIDINPVNTLTTDIQQQNSISNLRIYSTDKNIHIENPNQQQGKIKLSNAGTGQVVLSEDFSSQKNSIINVNVPTGTYIVNGVTLAENVSAKIVIR
ncbi:MAG: hypothetical protein PHT07_09140 [Paludibacter sp.]|nr:hypothetical protein [Paludibacter sp.]